MVWVGLGWLMMCDAWTAYIRLEYESCFTVGVNLASRILMRYVDVWDEPTRSLTPSIYYSGQRIGEPDGFFAAKPVSWVACIAQYPRISSTRKLDSWWEA